jgi:biotin transport system ATP-binding protein
MQMPELFRIESLSHRFNSGIDILSEVNLTIRDGDFLILAGRNGSGKTLLVRHLVGLSKPSSGKVLFREKPVETRLREARAAVGFVFQDTEAQILGQTVEEDVAFGPSNMGLSAEEIRQRTAEALKAAGLSGTERRRPETLSGGEKRRLAIAGVLAMRPQCLILDEPFANLDYESVNEVIRVCEELSSQGKTILVVTHEMEKVLRLASRLVILDSGEIVYDGLPTSGPPELFTSHGLACPYEGFFPWTVRRLNF